MKTTLKTISIISVVLAAGVIAPLITGCHSDRHASQQPISASGTAAAKPYPLKTCIVTGEKLGDHGQPYSFVYQGQQIKLCCEDCREDFNKEPAKYLQKLSAVK